MFAESYNIFRIEQFECKRGITALETIRKKNVLLISQASIQANSSKEEKNPPTTTTTAA